MSTKTETEDQPEIEKPEIVGEDGVTWGDTTSEPVPPEVLPERRPQDQAVERIADIALDSVVPRKDELLTLAMEARMLAYGNLVPGPLRGKPADVLLILLVGRDLGIAQTSALQQVYVVDGKPSLAPKLLNARLRHLKLGGIFRHPENSRTWAAALIVPWAGVERIDRGETIDGRPLKPIDVAIDQVEFTWDDAKMAGLVSQNCEPAAHGSGNACRCKQNWKNYPQRMLWWRAAGYAADDFFPEASLGLYAPDELGAVTDEDGQPIDVNSVEIPEGFERGRGGGGGGAQEDNSIATPEELWALQLRIRSLPDEGRVTLKKRWMDNASLRAPNGRPFSADLLPARLHGLVNSLLNGVEAQARTQGWSQDAALDQVREETDLCAGRLLGFLLHFSVLPPWPDAALEALESAETGAQAGESPDPDLAAQETAGEESQDAPSWVQEIIEEVKAMKPPEIADFLQLFSLPKSGNMQTKRARVAEAKVRDRERQIREAQSEGQ